MRKLPKLINRYTSSKDYYSYEKDYLYELKRMIQINFSIKNMTTSFLSDALKSVEELLSTRNNDNINKSSAYEIRALLKSYLDNYPVYYIDSSFIDLAFNTKIKEQIELTNFFCNKAIFLYPKKNKLNIQFSIISNNNNLVFPECTQSSHLSGFHFFNSYFLASLLPKKNILAGSQSYCDIFFKNSVKEDLEYHYTGLLIANIFLYMSAYKEDGIRITNESYSNGVGFKEGKSNLLTPPTIGFSEKEYVENQHKLISTPNPNLQGIKKQTHWRRGHWRQYDDGKLTWIRPCLINPITD